MNIQSSSNNEVIDNVLGTPWDFLVQHNLLLQGGGLGTDNSGNIYAVENTLGSSGDGIGTVTAFAQIDPATGESISVIKLLMGGTDVGFGFHALDIMPMSGLPMSGLPTSERILALTGLSGSDRTLLVDENDDGTFSTCPPSRCTMISLSGGALVFDVTGFSTYSSENNSGSSSGSGSSGSSVVPLWLLLMFFRSCDKTEA